MKDSSAWHRTSRPLEVCTAGGMLAVLSGSQRPRVGFRCRWAIPVFDLWVERSKMAVPVVSEPVPAVVGMAIRGFKGEGIGRPAPRGALTKVRKGVVGKVQKRFMSLAVSMTEPPPKARKASGWRGWAKAIAALMLEE